MKFFVNGWGCSMYASKPIHVLFPLALFALGGRCLVFDDWLIFGVACWLVAILTLAWIVASGKNSDKCAYWESVAQALEASSKNDLEQLAALGFKPDGLPEAVHVNLYDNDHSSRHFDLPVSSVKLQPLAQGLLSGRAFTERGWTHLLGSDEFRRLRGVLREKKLIEPISDKDNRQGFRLTDAGKELMQSLLPSPPPPSYTS